MTEHAAVVFVFFFLAEYGSIVLMCILNSLLFLGGYLPPINSIFYLITFIYYMYFGFLFFIEYFFSYLEYIILDLFIFSVTEFIINLCNGTTPLSGFVWELHNQIACSRIPFPHPSSITYYVYNQLDNLLVFIKSLFFYYPNLEGLSYGITLGLKSSIMIFTFIWARASFPRIRFDQLMSFCWTVILPILFAFIMFIPCILHSFDFLSLSISLQ